MCSTFAENCKRFSKRYSCALTIYVHLRGILLLLYLSPSLKISFFSHILWCICSSFALCICTNMRVQSNTETLEVHKHILMIANAHICLCVEYLFISRFTQQNVYISVLYNIYYVHKCTFMYTFYAMQNITKPKMYQAANLRLHLSKCSLKISFYFHSHWHFIHIILYKH